MIGAQFRIHGDGVLYESLAVTDILAFLPTEVLIEAVLGFGGRHHIEPFGQGVLTVGGEYLHLVAALEHVRQRNKGMVHFGADTMFA